MVYDKSIIPFLVQVLYQFLSGTFGSWPVAYIASTVRNEDTRDHFLVALGKNFEDKRYISLKINHCLNICLSIYNKFSISCLFFTGNKGLRYEILDPPSEKIFHYDDIIPIEILRVWHPSNKTI